MAKRKKLLLTIGVLLFSFSFFFFIQPQRALADQRCWTRSACTNYREFTLGMNKYKAADGFYTGTDAKKTCPNGGAPNKPNELGFCLPVGKTTTEITFGGKTSFGNMGEFIQVMFRYSVIVAGILAVIMIIFGGIEWIASAGNSSVITSARKKITGALTGLIIAILSYFILNLINPYLVNLRLPQAWLLNQEILMPGHCQLVPKETGIAKVSNNFVNLKNKQQEKVINNIKQSDFVTSTKQTAACGDYYVIQGSGGQECTGTYCAKQEGHDQVCYNNKCVTGELILEYSINQSFMDKMKPSYVPTGINGLEQGYLDTEDLALYGVCHSTDTKRTCTGNKYYGWTSSDRLTATENKGKTFPTYSELISKLKLGEAYKEADWKCMTGQKLVGYVFKTELHHTFFGTVLHDKWGLVLQDADLAIGFDTKGKAKVGLWDAKGKTANSIGPNNYIPLHYSGSLNISLDDNIVNAVLENPHKGDPQYADCSSSG